MHLHPVLGAVVRAAARHRAAPGPAGARRAGASQRPLVRVGAGGAPRARRRDLRRPRHGRGGRGERAVPHRQAVARDDPGRRAQRRPAARTGRDGAAGRGLAVPPPRGVAPGGGPGRLHLRARLLRGPHRGRASCSAARAWRWGCRDRVPRHRARRARATRLPREGSARGSASWPPSSCSPSWSPTSPRAGAAAGRGAGLVVAGPGRRVHARLGAGPSRAAGSTWCASPTAASSPSRRSARTSGARFPGTRSRETSPVRATPRPSTGGETCSRRRRRARSTSSRWSSRAASSRWTPRRRIERARFEPGQVTYL